ncbi:MAG: serine hydrolase domain-containing protein [Promethearchaeota archaeon]
MHSSSSKGIPKRFESVVQHLKEGVEKCMTEHHTSALAISVVTKEQVVWQEAFGHLDRERKQEVDFDTLFSIQSTSKLITALTFMMAVQEGVVKLDDKLVAYYPEFKVRSRWSDSEGDKITFRHLLSHQSGLPQFTRVGGVFDDSPHTFEERIESVIGTWLLAPVGQRFNYSNIGFDLVAYALQRITGKSFPDYVREKLATPLGITSLTYGNIELAKNPNHVIGYEWGARPVEFDYAFGFGCGVAWLNIADLTKLVQLLVNHGRFKGRQLVQPELFNEMVTSQIKDVEGYSYGLGVFIKGMDIRILKHDGGGYGYSGSLQWLPDHGIGVVVETNNEAHFPCATNQADKALDLMLEALGVERQEYTPETLVPGPVVTVDPTQLKRLEGVYAGVIGTLNITLREGKLFASLGSSEFELTAHGETQFTGKFPPALKFTFETKRNKHPSKLTIFRKGIGLEDLFYLQPLPGDERQGPNKPHWKQYVGLYRMYYYGSQPSHLGVAINDGHLVLKSFAGVTKLHEHERIKGVFFTPSGGSVVFEDGRLYNGNCPAVRIDNPVQDFSRLASTGERHRLLQKFVVDFTAQILEFLDRKDEADKLRAVKSQWS